MGSSLKALEELHKAISYWMEVKWTTSIEWLVGLGISAHGTSSKLNQHLLVKQILNDYQGNTYPKRSTLPEDSLETNDSEMMCATEYRSILGSLMYLSLPR